MIEGKTILSELGRECEEAFFGRQLCGEQKMNFRIIEQAIDFYLYGLYDSEIKRNITREEHEEAKNFIFGEQHRTLSFDYYWETVYPDIEPDAVREFLLLKYEGKMKNETNRHGRRADRRANGGDPDTGVGDHQPDQTEDWFECVLFGSDIDKCFT